MRMMAAAAHDARTHNSPHTHTRTTHHTQTKTPTHLGPAQRMRDPGEARLSSSSCTVVHPTPSILHSITCTLPA